VAYADMEFLAQTHVDVLNALENRKADDIKTDVTVEVPSKRVAEQLIDILEASPGTLLCMTTHGRGRSELFTGSVANSILREITSPVMLVGPHCDPSRFRVDGRIIVSADGSSTSEAILPVATAWAIVTHSAVEVVSVVEPEVARIGGQSHGDIAESAYVHRLANSIADDLGRTVNFEVLHHRHPAATIVDRAGSEDVSVVAMATHGVAGLARITAGSVTSEVVRKAPVPVLVVRPAHLSA
jgi:nucleotide-binding universal stress UspA family protein